MSIFAVTRRRFVQLLAGNGIFRSFATELSFLGQIPTVGQNSPIGGQAQIPQPTPKVSVRVFRVPGAEYKGMITQFAVEFMQHYRLKTPYPISRIFEIFPSQIADRGTSKDLVNRGSLSFDRTSVSNSGEVLEVKFTDQNVGRLSVVFLGAIKAAISVRANGPFAFTFDEAHQIPVVFFNLTPDLEIGSNQLLESIAFDNRLVSYTLREKTDATRRLRIEVDTSVSFYQKPGTRSTPQNRKPTVSELQSAHYEVAALTETRAFDLLSPVFIPKSFASQQSTLPPDECQDTRFFIGGIHCDCCGGHPADPKASCPAANNQTVKVPTVDHPITFNNQSGATLYLYYAFYKGNVIDCRSLLYDGPVAYSEKRSFVVPAGLNAWFKFQKKFDSQCSLEDEKFGWFAYGGSSQQEDVVVPK
jgi:hypothetical protein